MKIPEVQIVERIQEPIVDFIFETTENIAEIPVVQEQVIVQEILDVVVPLPPVEEFTEPVYNPSPSGTDRGRGDYAQHYWKFCCARAGDCSGTPSYC